MGEYGVHWNFFTTIAVVTLLGNAVQVAPQHALTLALAVTAAHQWALTAGGREAGVLEQGTWRRGGGGVLQLSPPWLQWGPC